MALDNGARAGKLPVAPRPKTRSAGFTLVELAVVLVIIGILASFILKAATDGIRRAEERATQSLIIKLETGMTNRLDALLNDTVDPNLAHRFLASIFYQGNTVQLSPKDERQRAEVIARMDQLKNELPDVFLVQSVAPTDPYPLNFACLPYGPVGSIPAYNFIYPLGNSVPPPYGDGGVDPMGKGIYGASYAAAGAIYKNLGYYPQGYDGIDNNNNGLIDERAEGVINPQTGAPDPAVDKAVTQRLQSHKHKTARAEMLYALLVESRGPQGSVFSPDDFTNKEVQDTDGDGLPEFVDAWGEPLLFFRWPVEYSSDIQRGRTPYAAANALLSATLPREQNPLDPGQLLMAPAWWWSGYNTGAPSDLFAASAPMSGHALAVQTYFMPLIDPFASPSLGVSPTQWWSRGGGPTGNYQMRAFFSRFVIASAGLDRSPGFAQVGVDYYRDLGVDFGTATAPSGPVPLNVPNLINIENRGATITPYRNNDLYMTPSTSPANTAINTWLTNAGGDDITNHNVLASGGGLR